MRKKRIEEQTLEYENPLAHLLQIGSDKGYVTLDDMSEVYPKAENNVDQLEEAFSALLTADIPYVESDAEAEELFADDVDDNLDTDDDGKISKDEYDTANEERFNRLDKNNDGQVDDTEMPRQRRLHRFGHHRHESL